MKFYQEKGCYDELCFGLNNWKEKRKERDSDIILVEMKIEFGTDYFYCSEFGDVGLKSSSECGIFCELYKPRNSKNGRCRFSKNCYEPTDKIFRLTEKLKLIKINEGEL